MSTIRITRDCNEFGISFKAGQEAALLTPLHDAAMVISRLATFTRQGASDDLPTSGIIPLTSVMFENPATFGLHEWPDRTYVFDHIRYYWSADRLVPIGGHGLTVSGKRAAGEVRTARLCGGRAQSFQWLRNGAPIAGANDIDPTGTVSTYTMTAADVAPGVEVTVQAVGVSMIGDGRVANFTTPTLDAPAFDSQPASGTAISYTGGAAHGVPAPTVAFEVVVDGRPVPADYVPTVDDAGCLMTVTQVARNAMGVARRSVSAFVQHALVAPTVAALPVVGGTLMVGEPLHFTGPSFAGSGGATTIQWLTGAGAAIPGATAATYTPTAPGTYRVSVTQANGAGSATATSQPVTVAANVDTRPRYGTGPATAAQGGAALAFLASLAPVPASAPGGTAGGPFTVAPSAQEYGWVAVDATGSQNGVTFTDALGSGGWQGAGEAGDFAGVSPAVSTSVVLVTDADGVTWRLFRQDYAGAAWTGAIA